MLQWSLLWTELTEIRDVPYVINSIKQRHESMCCRQQSADAECSRSAWEGRSEQSGEEIEHRCNISSVWLYSSRWHTVTADGSSISHKKVTAGNKSSRTYPHSVFIGAWTCVKSQALLIAYSACKYQLPGEKLVNRMQSTEAAQDDNPSTHNGESKA